MADVGMTTLSKLSWKPAVGFATTYEVKNCSKGGTIAIRQSTDGDHVFVAIEAHGDEPGAIDVVKAAGGKPKTLVADREHPSHLVYDARFGLFFTTWGKGVELVTNAALGEDAAADPIQVLPTKAVTSLAVGPDHVFVSSDPGETNEKKGELLRLPLSKIELP